MADSIIAIPNHCDKTTGSFKIKNAMVTETGNSNEDRILPKPNPVLGKPLFINIGGIIVPNKAKKTPYIPKIEKLNFLFCIINVDIITINNPPYSIYNVLIELGKLRAILFAVYKVVVNEQAAKIPNNKP